MRSAPLLPNRMEPQHNPASGEHCAATPHATAPAACSHVAPRYCTTPSLSTSYGMGATVCICTPVIVKPMRGCFTSRRRSYLSSRSAEVTGVTDERQHAVCVRGLCDIVGGSP